MRRGKRHSGVPSPLQLRAHVVIELSSRRAFFATESHAQLVSICVTSPSAFLVYIGLAIVAASIAFTRIARDDHDRISARSTKLLLTLGLLCGFAALMTMAVFSRFPMI